MRTFAIITLLWGKGRNIYTFSSVDIAREQQESVAPEGLGTQEPWVTARQAGQCPHNRDTDPQHLNKSRVGRVMTTRVSQQLSNCQTRPEQWGPTSNQIVKSVGQDHYSSSNATPKPRGGQQPHKTSHSSFSHSSSNRNLIQSYTKVSYHIKPWAPAGQSLWERRLQSLLLHSRLWQTLWRENKIKYSISVHPETVIKENANPKKPRSLWFLLSQILGIS